MRLAFAQRLSAPLWRSSLKNPIEGGFCRARAALSYKQWDADDRKARAYARRRVKVAS